MPRFLAALALLFLLPAAPVVASAEVHRCSLPSGTVYTDRRCDELGGQDFVVPPQVAQTRSYRTACPRTLRDLAYELSASIEAHDVNRLAAIYDWAGMATQPAYALMSRLQVLVDRPLAEVQPVYPGSSADDPYADVAPRHPPVGLRVEQVSKGGTTPVHTVMGLRRNLDCWFVTLGGARRSPARAASSASDSPVRPVPAPPPPPVPEDVPVDTPVN